VDQVSGPAVRDNGLVVLGGGSADPAKCKVIGRSGTLLRTFELRIRTDHDDGIAKNAKIARTAN
jgi:hypothetical protein